MTIITANEYLATFQKGNIMSKTWYSNLETYLDNNFNVLLIGHKGVGKTSVIKHLFDSKGLKWLYFNGPTMDPWINFVGVPKEVDGKLEFILPADLAEDKVEAIFIDEPNRAHKAIRNAILELTQFKSINGRPFKNLRVVWAAINPDDDTSYDVERLDDALTDRFEIQIDVPNHPDLDYFTKKFGPMGQRACEWWNNLEAPAKAKLSPRKLEHSLRLYTITKDPRPALPKGINASSLISTLDKGSFFEQFMAADDNIKATLINSKPDNTVSLFKMHSDLAHKYSHFINPEYLNKILEDECQWLFDTTDGLPEIFYKTTTFDKKLSDKFWSKCTANYKVDNSVVDKYDMALPPGENLHTLEWETDDSILVNITNCLSQLFVDGKLNIIDKEAILSLLGDNSANDVLKQNNNPMVYKQFYREFATLAKSINLNNPFLNMIIDIGSKCTK